MRRRRESTQTIKRLRIEEAMLRKLDALAAAGIHVSQDAMAKLEAQVAKDLARPKVQRT